MAELALKEIQEVATELGARFTEFKAANDARFEAIDAEKGKLAGVVESLNEKMSALSTLKTELEGELKAVKRPGGGKGNPHASEHKSAFLEFVRKGKDAGLAELERKTLQTDVAEDGGYSVPEELDRSLLETLKDAVVMRQAANVVTMGTPNYTRLVNLGGTNSGWVGEHDARPETLTSKLTAIKPFMGEIYGYPMATQTMLDDSYFDVEGWMASELAQEFADQEEQAFTFGDGVNKPKGFLAYDSTAESDKARAFGKLQHVDAAGAAVTGDDLLKLIYTMRKVYRGGSQFMLNNNTLFNIRLLKDAEGNYLWRPGLELGQPSSILGYGVMENEYMPDIASDAKAIAFGDFKRGYTIIDRIGTRVLRDPYTRKPYVGLYTTKRVGGMLVDSHAIKLLKIGA